MCSAYSSSRTDEHCLEWCAIRLSPCPGVQTTIVLGQSRMRYAQKLWIEDLLKDVVYLPFE